MLQLRHATPAGWADLAIARLDAFLQDHAANERKVAHSALTLAVQHPTKTALADALVAVAAEEMDHFLRIYGVLRERGLTLGQDVPDRYMGALRRALRTREVEEYLLDRLVLSAIVEARGCERFALLAERLQPGPLKTLYTELTGTEARHHALYLRLARQNCDPAQVEGRLGELLDLEASVHAELPLRPALH